MRTTKPWRSIMPNVDTLIPEITKQTIEPISEQIVHRLLAVLGIGNIFKSNIFLKSDDLQLSNFEDEDHDKRTEINRCDVEIIPGYNPLETTFSAQRSRDLDAMSYAKRWTDYPIFADPRANIRLYEITVPCSVELKFSLRLKSVELSDTVNMMLYSRYLTDSSTYDYNDIQFAYAMSDKIILLMNHMYNMQDDVKKLMTFQQYLSIGSNKAITLLVNRSRLDGDLELVVQRSNIHVLGRLDYAGDKPDNEDINKVVKRRIVTFSYFYQFEKPAIFRLVHPIMVNNKLIHTRFINEPSYMSYGDLTGAYPDIKVNNYLLKNNAAAIDLDAAYPAIRYPVFDDWMRSSAVYQDLRNKYQELFVGLLSLTVDETTKDLSLTVDLRNEIFPLMTPAVVPELEYLITQFDYDRDPLQSKDDLFRRQSIFDISIFCNDTMMPFERLHLDDNLVLTVSGHLDISKIYRLVISQIRNIRILNTVYVYYMLEHPDYYVDFLALYMNYLIEMKFVKLVKNIISGENTVENLRRETQRFVGGNLSPRPITIHRYVIEIMRNR